MFMPDGRVLIMDNDLYKRVIDQSIVLDLLDQDGQNVPGSTHSQFELLQQHNQVHQLQDRSQPNMIENGQISSQN